MPLRNSVAILTLACGLLLILMTTPVLAGSMTFYANGEDLATEGFLAPKLTKDSWSLTFDHIYVTLTEITAYQTNPPHDPHRNKTIKATAQAALAGTFTIDLVKEADATSRVLVGTAENAQPGHYNAISWRMVTATSGAAAGYSVVMIGTATKDGRAVHFKLSSNEQRTYRCGEFVGDERKGFLQQGGNTDLELTFHLDHIFGRADKSSADNMNTSAFGFTPFAGDKSESVIRLQGLHIGHAGEGHCRVEWH